MIRRKVLGGEHPDTLWTMFDLADYYAEAGRPDDAIELREELLPLREKVLGANHQYTRFASSKLADSYITAGRWEDAVTLMESWTARSAQFSLGSLKLSAIQAWLGMSADHLATCRRVLQQAKHTEQATQADEAARSYSLIPSSDAQLLDAALVLARRAVSLGQGEPGFAWYQMGLGMAEYRSGDYVTAEKTLIAAEENYLEVIPASTPIIQTIARFYRAMSIFRQGNVAESRQVFANSEARMKPVPIEGQPLRERVGHNDLICWLAYKEAQALLYPNL